MQFSAPMEAHMALKNTDDEMFLSSKLLKHSSPINRLLHINLDTSHIPMQHLCITTPEYGGLYRTFYDIRKTQFFVDFSRHTSAKMKNDRHVVV